jgi:hypothetical protein
VEQLVKQLLVRVFWEEKLVNGLLVNELLENGLLEKELDNLLDEELDNLLDVELGEGQMIRRNQRIQKIQIIQLQDH